MTTDKEILDLLKEFQPGVYLRIYKVFDEEYKIGFIVDGMTYLPGVGSYYPFKEALQEAVTAYKEIIVRDK
jgi:hypothetical protein